MGMFAKVIAFLDKAAGVPAWVTHADNIRKLEERGCPLLAKAIVENEILWPLSSYSLEEMLPQLAGVITIGKVVADNNINSTGLKQLVHEVVAAYEGPVDGPIEVLQDFVDFVDMDLEIVEVDTPSSLAKFAEEVFAASEDECQEDALAALRTDQELSELSMEMVVDGQAAAASLVAALPEATPDPQAHKQLVQGMMKVISCGRKPGPTLRVLKTMSAGDQAAITEALEEMASQGNRLASAILEDPSL